MVSTNDAERIPLARFGEISGDYYHCSLVIYYPFVFLDAFAFLSPDGAAVDIDTTFLISQCQQRLSLLGIIFEVFWRLLRLF